MCECIEYYDERYGKSGFLCEACYPEWLKSKDCIAALKAERDRLEAAIRHVLAAEILGSALDGSYRIRGAALEEGGDDE